MGERPTVLVVDDTPANVRLLEAILDPSGYDVVTATSGQAALDAVGTGGIDLVLLDINMPGMNGLEVCRRIREADPHRVLPVVMVTAAHDESTSTAIDAGADDFIARPFDQAELLARITSLLRVKQLHDIADAQARELAQLNTSLQARVEEQLDELLRLRRLQRFLSPHIADVMLNAGDEAILEPHRREIAVVFCDLRGFTRFAGSAEPEELLDVLREFHEILGRLVGAHNATVGHFAGDGVMLFFNDPMPCDAPALKAAALALALRDEVVGLRDAWHRRGHELDIGIGISLGFATLGTIGFEGRYDYTALGLVVNQASRLCAAAVGGEVLAGARAFGEIEQHVEAEQIDPVEAKGFAEPIPAWSIVRLVEPVAIDASLVLDPRTDVRVLGPLQVAVDGEHVELASGKERALVARLAADLNDVVSADRLIDDLWGENPPESAATSLRVHVSRVRKALVSAGAGALIVTRPPGYALEADATALDAARFEAGLTEGRAAIAAGQTEEGAMTLRAALALWRGAALAEIADAPNVAPAAQRLEELRLLAMEECYDAELRCGRHAAVATELAALVKAHPLRERLWGQLMLALYRNGRQAEALRAFQDLRALLGEEVGLEPSPDLVRLEAAIVAQDPTLELVAQD